MNVAWIGYRILIYSALTTIVVITVFEQPDPFPRNKTRCLKTVDHGRYQINRNPLPDASIEKISLRPTIS